MNIRETEAATCAVPDASDPSAEFPRLNPGEVHVWKGFLDGSSHERDRAILVPEELERAGRYRFPQGRMRFVAGRALLRMILGGYLGRSPSKLSFSYGPHGKPRLVQEAWEEPLYFNVTHAGPVALYALARDGEVGIDVEHVREIPDWESIAGSCFSPFEKERLRNLPEDRRRHAFFQAWTRREALLKATGDGLTGEKAGWLCAPDSGYSTHSLIPVPGYLATLASGFSPSRVIFMTWWGAPHITDSVTVET
jgi:4'-phosphopantetheinyl transferase